MSGLRQDQPDRAGPVAAMLILLVRLYQLALSPLVGHHCRFVPTCSQYFIQAVRRRGAVRGAMMGVWRLLRCHPFGRGGYDPVEAKDPEHGTCKPLS